jgi:hypothetical protein
MLGNKKQKGQKGKHLLPYMSHACCPATRTSRANLQKKT